MVVPSDRVSLPYISEMHTICLSLPMSKRFQTRVVKMKILPGFNIYRATINRDVRYLSQES